VESEALEDGSDKDMLKICFCQGLFPDPDEVEKSIHKERHGLYISGAEKTTRGGVNVIILGCTITTLCWSA
jgi:hypothetical protein